MGLSQSSVLSIEQDSYGFIWLGTRDGLNLYDGGKIHIYKNIPGDDNSISGNLINDIAEDKDRNLWIAHNNGISLLDRKTGFFTNYQIPANSPEIRSIAIIDGQVWACGWGGLFLWTKNDTFTPYSPNNNDVKLYLSTSKIFQSNSKEGYWIATTNNGLCYLDTKSKKVKKVFSGAEDDLRIEDIVFHPNGKMYVGTYGKGLLECDADGNIIKRWNKGSTGGNFKIDNIRSLTIDRSGTLWIGGFQGLATLNPADYSFKSLTPTYSIFEVDDISIRSLFVDRNGSVWIGTYHHGAFLYDDYFSRFVTMPLRINGRTPIHGMVSAFALSSTGKAFVATENGYLFEYPDYTANNTRHVIQPIGDHNLVFKSLFYQEDKEQLWIGTLRDGLFLKDKNNRLTAVPLSTPGEQSTTDTIEYGIINNIIPYDEERVWLLTDKGGALHLFDLNTKKIIDYPASEMLSKQVNKGSGKHISRLHATDYLLATKGSGLIYFRNNGDTTTKRILTEVKDINHITVHRDNIYVSTQNNGLFVLDKNFNVVKQYSTTDNLRNNNVLSTFVDQHGRVWINTFNGLNVIKSDGELSTYDSKNGFQLAEVNAWKQAIDKQQNTVFFAGGKDAWIHFEPNKLSDNKYVPTVYLTAIRLGNKTISDLDYLNSAQNQLKLAADESLLTMEFAGTNYLMPQNSRFRYMMEGYDQDWVYTDRQGFARYNKLPSGRYTFKVQASNNDGVWSENIARLDIRKYPPIWASWQAYLLYGLLVLSVLYYLRKNELKKRRLKEEIRSKEKEKQLIAEAHALKIKYFNDISHEIRTPLSLILHPIEELMETETLSPREKRKILSMQYHGKNMLLLVNQLLEINRLELKKEHLNTTPTYLRELISIIDNSFQPIAQRAGIFWEVDMQETTEHPLEIDRLQMEKVLLNLLSNAFKFTPQNGTVKLVANTLEIDHQYVHLRIKVMDNGIGITEQDLPHIFERLYKGKHQNNVTGSGIGLALVKAIVKDLMKGDIHVSSVWKQGTTFEINIPHIPIAQHKSVEEYKNSLLTSHYLYDSPEDHDEDNVPLLHDTGSSDSRKSILLVEDNIIIAKMLVDHFTPYYNLLSMTNAEDAIVFLKDNEVDLILSDIMLPGMNGKDFCVEIKSNIITSHIPFILLTAVDGEESIIAGLELGADDYVTKPFIMKELSLRINNILKQRKRWQNYIDGKNTDKKSTIRLNKYDEELMDNIDRRLAETLDDASYTVEDLSREVGLSRVHLFRKLKALTGFSPSQYIRNYRLNTALSIIQSEKIRVADLAYKVGFQDPNYFLKCFKDKFGKTPTEFSKEFS